ncbi:MAG: acyltransferase [Neomegalonema sp.]|nr:acyltransferase [Neomegalonema sp.]
MSLPYRRDIDALRAVSVLLVALYHAKLFGLTGGYLGVDIFFVISGYLITGIILSESRRGAFDLAGFVERRLRRVAPALICVTLVVIIASTLLRSPRDLALFGESVSLLPVFGSNFFFYNNLDYFGPSPDTYWLLHCWSLAVEFQFYIFFALLLVAVLRWSKAPVGAWLIGVAALSFVAAAIVVHSDPRAAFFLTPFRLWEFVAGGLLTLRGPRVASRHGRCALAVLGLILILAPAFLYDASTVFPGLTALPPVLGAMLFIWSGQRSRDLEADETAAHRLLANPVVVYIGRASYSFYLWHWPVLAAAAYMSSAPLTPVQSGLALAAAFAISAASLHLIERPLRRAGRRRRFFGGLAASIAAILLFGWAVQESDGWPGRYPGLAPLLAKDSYRYGAAPGACVSFHADLPDDIGQSLDPRSCRIGEAAPGKPVIAVWGDSHAWAIAPGFVEWAKAREAVIYVIWSGICPPALGYERPYPTKFVDCGAHNAAALKLIERLQVKEAFLLARWRHYPVPSVEGGLVAALQALKARGVRTAVFAQGPELGVTTPTYIFRATVGGWARADKLPDRYLAKAAARERLYRQAEKAGARRIALASPFCAAALCQVAAPDLASYFADSHHLSRVGARFAIRALSAQMALAGPPPPPADE